MNHIIFGESHSTYNYVFLFPQLRKNEIQKNYIDPFGINSALALDLYYPPHKKKVPAKVAETYFLEEVVPVLNEVKALYLMIADGDYFKKLTGCSKIEVNLGYVLDCKYGPWKCVYIPNFKAIFYDPKAVQQKITQGINAALAHNAGTYEEPGKHIIHGSTYPSTTKAIETWLKRLVKHDLTIDIETFSLKHPDAGIGTIAFAWDQHNGISFPVDLCNESEKIRDLLRWFFMNHTGKALYHNITFDVYVLTYQLFMNDLLDTKGLLNGLSILLKNFDDTKLISYLATNSCAGNALSLKDQAQEFAGNYAKNDIKDIRKIPLKELLEYNLVDCLSTWFVYNKNHPKMVRDNQEDIYLNLFKPAVVDIIQMQLTGLPVDMDQVLAAEQELEKDKTNAEHTIFSSEAVKEFIPVLNQQWVDKRNQKLKKKRVTLDDANEEFNPNSPIQLQQLLYEVLELPVIERTAKGQPSTGKAVLEALKTHTGSNKALELLDGLIDYAAVEKILSSFIPAMKFSYRASDNWHYMFGNFNLGGTVSGRLSSNSPNLQNLPSSGTKYAKIIKSCFKVPEGWLFVGLDFNSLEDRISALTTKDPNKLKIYTEGMDGHSYRAYSYWPEKMPDIDSNDPNSINSIKYKYPELRQESKSPTFALTYAGTYHTLMKNCGFSEEEARKIENRYHDLYSESDKWVQDKLDQAAVDGFVEVAFGLHVRTPLLKQVVRGNSRTPYEAQAEGRTAGNALGQSWGLLNTRAGIEFNNKVRESKFKYNIKPCAHIHDAQYFIIRDDLDTIKFVNDYLVKAVQWQEHPDIKHDEVKLGGEFFICWPDWTNEIIIPNYSSKKDIINIVKKVLEE